MRIVDVNEFYSPTGGGVRSYVDRKLRVFGELGHDLTVIAPGRVDVVEERPGGRIVYVKSPGMPFDRNYGLFWEAEPITRLLDRFDPDVVECSSPWRPAWIVADWRGRALKSFFMHNDNIDAYAKRWFQHLVSPDRIERAFAWYSRYMIRFLARFDVVVSNGPALAKRMERRGIAVDAAIGLGIERAHFSPDLRDERLRANLLAECGLPVDAHLLIGIGRHHPEKRWTMVVDAVERAAATRPIGLVLIGQGPETRALERRLAHSPHVRLFRPTYDRAAMARIMASGDALIHGCEAETFGLVAAEALASGLPLIVPNEGGPSEIAGPDFAETFPARDARGCADAILRMTARDRTAVRRAAAAAAGGVASDLDHAAALVAFYAERLSAKRLAA